jgi:hypothetical protein
MMGSIGRYPAERVRWMGEVMMILGCRGWFYDDWLGTFHPLAIAKKGHRQAYYARSFPSLGINRSQFTVGGISCA